MYALLLLASLTINAADRPNVVFILADDLGYGDLGCYGVTDIKTPRIDTIARDGVKFTDFHSNGPVCTPTRCGFITGRYQQRFGGLEWAIPPGGQNLGLPKNEPTIATALQKAGYATAMSGKWHLGYTSDWGPNAHGFERYFGLLSGNHDYVSHREHDGRADLFLNDKPVEMEGYSTHLITKHAIKWLDEIKDKPFFLYVAYNAPHFPFQTPETKQPVLQRNFNTGTREIYGQMVESLDEGVGKILDRLDELGLSKNTLVVFASDNGGAQYSRNAPFAKDKGTLWEGGIRVSCVARFPGVIPAGKVTNQVAITMDWTATIEKLAGATQPDSRPLEGIDLMPIISGQSPEVARTLFWRRVDVKGVQSHRAVRDGDWKYIDAPKEGPFLYDLASDLSEAKNVASENADVVARLKQKADDWETMIEASRITPKAIAASVK